MCLPNTRPRRSLAKLAKSTCSTPLTPPTLTLYTHCLSDTHHPSLTVGVRLRAILSSSACIFHIPGPDGRSRSSQRAHAQLLLLPNIDCLHPYCLSDIRHPSLTVWTVCVRLREILSGLACTCHITGLDSRSRGSQRVFTTRLCRPHRPKALPKRPRRSTVRSLLLSSA